MKVAIITAIRDDYDTVKPALHQDGVETEWVFVTDHELPARRAEQLGWRGVVEEHHPATHPNLVAKRPKMLPWLYTDAEASIWIDGSFQVTSPTFAFDVMRFADPIAQFVHPWRDCIYEEAEESARLVKYAHLPVLEQVEAYRPRHPEHWGLWAAGVIARRHNRTIRALGYLWLDQCRRWTYQDQLSEPPVLHEVGLRPTALPGNHLDNAWLSYQGSGRHG